MIWKEKDVEQFYEKYKRFVFYIVNQKVDSRHDGDDICQQVFINVIKNFDRIWNLDEEQQKAYISAMASNAVYDFRKRNYSLPEFNEIATIDEQVDLVDSTYELLCDRELSKAVWQCVEKLEDKNSLYGKCIALRYYMGFKDNEIAEALNITNVNCRAILHRARKKLKEILSDPERSGVINLDQYK